MTDLFTADAVAEIVEGAEEGKKPLAYKVETRDGPDSTYTEVVVGVSGWQREGAGVKSKTPSSKDQIEALRRSNEELREKLRRLVGTSPPAGEPSVDP